ncbi:hypothetical protein CVT24_006936 [Panaeolus cyanescens]|uniref:Uncharacterized protein n=1 Tax=Panaeolus cyanescens TaxID=181874 RepID=A0A409VK44_9AGAR|nr:hypothetical protein CVT24_006936 [Panaeolus cyanescens]
MNRDSYDARSSSSSHSRHQPPGRSQSTVPSSSVQQYPHQPGDPECRCPACHLKNELFPRTRDGKIVLPSPWSATSRVQTPVAMPRPIPASSRPPRVPSALAGAGTGLHDIQRPQSSGGRRLIPDDRGEGSSRGRSTHAARAHPATITLGPTSTTPPLSSPRSSSDVHQSRRARSRASRPYDPNAKKKNESGSPTPSLSGPSNQLRPWQMLSEENADISRRSPRLTSYPPGPGAQSELLSNFQGNPYIVEGVPQALSSPGPVNRHGGDHQINMSGSFSMLSMDPAASPSNERATQHRHRNLYTQSSTGGSPHRRESSFGVSSSATLDASINATGMRSDTDHPRVIRFSSRSQNPQPQLSRAGAFSSIHDEEGTNPALFTLIVDTIVDHHNSLAGPSSMPSHPQQTQMQATRIRFQEPVIPESSSGGSSRPGEASIVQVKWDSDRKRRQGYFAQEEGSEKSPFRHYNKADCDFDN